jgi:hypothetical protein
MIATSNESLQAVENIASISEENGASAEEVSASSEEMSAQVEEVTASAQSLAEMAGLMQQAVSQFALWEGPSNGSSAAKSGPALAEIKKARVPGKNGHHPVPMKN